jgi:hypothetical protein
VPILNQKNICLFFWLAGMVAWSCDVSSIC